TEISTLSLHDALPILQPGMVAARWYRDAAQGKIPNPVEQALDVAPEAMGAGAAAPVAGKLLESAPAAVPPVVRGVARGANKVLRSEEHTSELQSPCNL